MGCYRNIIHRSSSSSVEVATAAAAGGARKMIWGLALLFTKMRRRRRRKVNLDKEEESDRVQENNKSWLLAAEAEAEVEGAAEELHSVHSSFRFSFGSQVEAEEVGTRPTAVLLLVNMEDEDEREAESELGERRRRKWTRLESLEKSISPVSGNLVRFSYSQIRAATREFCQGNRCAILVPLR